MAETPPKPVGLPELPDPGSSSSIPARPGVAGDTGRFETLKVGGPTRFPTGKRILPKLAFGEEVFDTVDGLIEGGQCPDGRFEVESGERRLTCLIHRGKLYLAGIQDGETYQRIPLSEFPSRAREMRPASCRLVESDPTEILISAVHFEKQPVLRGSVRFVDPAKVLEVLAEEQRDAALSFTRKNVRTLLFLHKGKPARLFFGDSRDDPGGGTLEERMLLFAFGPESGDGLVEVFTDLRLTPDPDAGTPLSRLVSGANPAPPATVFVHLDGHEVRQRPFTGPSMVIGRDPKVDLFIDNLGVSRRHAVLTWERGDFYIEDLGSSNGTFFNKEKIGRHKISDGDKIRVGKFELTLVRTAVEQQAAETMFVSRLSLANQLPPPEIVAGEVRMSLERDLLIGKGEGVDLQAKGWGVEPVHARVSSSETFGKANVVCFGKGSVKHEGKAHKETIVSMNESFTIGRSTFELRPSSAISTPSR